MTKSARETYIHGTEPAEQERLALLNRLTNTAFVEFLEVQSGVRVLEVGSGLGLLTADVAAAADGVHATGLESSSAQIAAARRPAHVDYVQADARYVPFPTDHFDLVYARFLLEHVFDPVAILKEMKRVVRPGGRVAACENDISLLRFDPACPRFDDVWNRFQAYQQTLGGDGLIGRRLYGLFHEAGLSGIELSVQPEVHRHGSPGFDGWVQNIIGNVESARRGLIESGFCEETRIDVGIAELQGLRSQANASSWFVWNRAIGTKLGDSEQFRG